jgi:hypothetical protein
VKSVLFIKFPRVLLAVIVSIWMAGGCLFGCNMQAMGAETVGLPEIDSRATVVEGDTCEPPAAHSCCTKPKQAAQPQQSAQPSVPGETLTTAPRGMADCPLMVNTTAVTSRSSGNVPEPARTPVALSPKIESQVEQVPLPITSSFRPNRGPTHLRCCVFLI